MSYDRSDERQRSRPVTIRDVAAAAGVSPGTVSKVINRRGQISQRTRDHVLEVAQRLDFRVNDLARGLFSGRTYSVALLTTDGFGRFSVPVMLGAEDALGFGEISVMLCDTRDDPIRERHYVDVMLGRRVDGFIVTGRRSNRRQPIAAPAHMPVVYALTPSASDEDFSVVVDDEGAGRQAAAHLLATGRRNIAHITGPQRFDAVARRLAGFSEELRRAEVAACGEPLYGEWTEAWGAQATQLVLHQHPEVDAIYCASDTLARGSIDALRESGVSVPDEISVVGTDNWEVMAMNTRPQLTTVDLSLEQVGRVAAQALLRAIDGEPAHGIQTVPCRLVPRASTAVRAPQRDLRATPPPAV